MFKKMIARWLLNNVYRSPLFDAGIMSILEREVYLFNLLHNAAAKRIEVPNFMHVEYLAECNNNPHFDPYHFAGIPIFVSHNNRFTIS